MKNRDWNAVKEHMGSGELPLGEHASYWVRKSPRRLLHNLSHLKFAAKLIGPGRRVLEIGCAEGLGAHLLATECGFALGLDLDAAAIASAKANFSSDCCEFDCRRFDRPEPEPFDAAVSLDLIEHLTARDAETFLAHVAASLTEDGVAVIGTPNLAADTHASAVSRRGHINLYDHQRLDESMRRHFAHVFLFAANDEMVHTGFLPMAHYLLAVGCGRRSP